MRYAVKFVILSITIYFASACGGSAMAAGHIEVRERVVTASLANEVGIEIYSYKGELNACSPDMEEIWVYIPEIINATRLSSAHLLILIDDSPVLNMVIPVTKLNKNENIRENREFHGSLLCLNKNLKDNAEISLNYGIGNTLTDVLFIRGLNSLESKGPE